MPIGTVFANLVTLEIGTKLNLQKYLIHASNSVARRIYVAQLDCVCPTAALKFGSKEA